jgi:hypothetical protein
LAHGDTEAQKLEEVGGLFRFERTFCVFAEALFGQQLKSLCLLLLPSLARELRACLARVVHKQMMCVGLRTALARSAAKRLASEWRTKAKRRLLPSHSRPTISHLVHRAFFSRHEHRSALHVMLRSTSLLSE